jgi:hypothetical protein
MELVRGQYGQRRGQRGQMNSPTQIQLQRGPTMIQAQRCLSKVQPLPHIYVRIRCMSELGGRRRFVKLMDLRRVEGD